MSERRFKITHIEEPPLPPFLEGKELESAVPIRELYESTPELAEIGSLAEYTEYLDSIFPETKIKAILFHCYDGEAFEKPRTVNFDNELGEDLYGFYMAERPVIYGENYMALKINARSVKGVSATEVVAFNEEDVAKLRQEGVDTVFSRVGGPGKDGFEYNFSEIVVFDSENIHVVGSKHDVEKFRDWKQEQ